MNTALTLDDYLVIVAQAWRETLPEVEFRADRSWADGGADSLKSLQLIMRLEDSLCMSIPLDLLRPETTPAMLSTLLHSSGQG